MEVEWLIEVANKVSETLLHAISFEWNLENILKVIGAVFGIFATAFTAYIRWRNTGRRRARRLLEFIQAEEQRLRGAQQSLAEIANRPLPNDVQNKSTVFPLKQLNSGYVNRTWGRLRPAHAKIQSALEKARKQREFSRLRTQRYEDEEFLSLLSLGALADSKGKHSDALKYFDQAASIRPNDLHALEYAGFEQVITGNADASLSGLTRILDRRGEVISEQASKILSETDEERGINEEPLRYFARMLAICAMQNDQIGEARARRNIALAYESLALPKRGMALKHLLIALDRYPDITSPLEVARTWEQIGYVRWASKAYAIAKTSFGEARTRYAALQTKDGNVKADEMTQIIKKIAEQQLTAGGEEGQVEIE